MATLAKPNPFQEILLRKNIFFPFRGGVGTFTTYFLGTKPNITKDFEPDEHVIALFKGKLDKEEVPYTEVDLNANMDWIKREIKKEAFISIFGVNAGDPVELEDDAQVNRAIESLPQARALYQNVRKVIAQRTAGQVSQP